MSTYTDEELLELEGVVQDENGRLRFRTIWFDKGGFSRFEDE